MLSSGSSRTSHSHTTFKRPCNNSSRKVFIDKDGTKKVLVNGRVEEYIPSNVFRSIRKGNTFKSGSSIPTAEAFQDLYDRLRGSEDALKEVVQQKKEDAPAPAPQEPPRSVGAARMTSVAWLHNDYVGNPNDVALIDPGYMSDVKTGWSVADIPAKLERQRLYSAFAFIVVALCILFFVVVTYSFTSAIIDWIASVIVAILVPLVKFLSDKPLRALHGISGSHWATLVVIKAEFLILTKALKLVLSYAPSYWLALGLYGCIAYRAYALFRPPVKIAGIMQEIDLPDDPRLHCVEDMRALGARKDKLVYTDPHVGCAQITSFRESNDLFSVPTTRQTVLFSRELVAQLIATIVDTKLSDAEFEQRATQLAKNIHAINIQRDVGLFHDDLRTGSIIVAKLLYRSRRQRRAVFDDVKC